MGSKDGEVHFIDPVAIVEDIVEEREEVTIEWKKEMSLVTDTQMKLRKKLLILQMAKWGHPVEESTCEEEETVKDKEAMCEEKETIKDEDSMREEKETVTKGFQ